MEGGTALLSLTATPAPPSAPPAVQGLMGTPQPQPHPFGDKSGGFVAVPLVPGTKRAPCSPSLSSVLQQQAKNTAAAARSAVGSTGGARAPRPRFPFVLEMPPLRVPDPISRPQRGGVPIGTLPATRGGCGVCFGVGEGARGGAGGWLCPVMVGVLKKEAPGVGSLKTELIAPREGERLGGRCGVRVGLLGRWLCGGRFHLAWVCPAWEGIWVSPRHCPGLGGLLGAPSGVLGCLPLRRDRGLTAVSLALVPLRRSASPGTRQDPQEPDQHPQGHPAPRQVSRGGAPLEGGCSRPRCLRGGTELAPSGCPLPKSRHGRASRASPRLSGRGD